MQERKTYYSKKCQTLMYANRGVLFIITQLRTHPSCSKPERTVGAG